MAVTLGRRIVQSPVISVVGPKVSILSTRSRSGNPLTVICRACGLVWSDPRPHDARQILTEAEYRLAYKNT